MAAQSVEGYQAVIPGKIVVSRSPKTNEVVVEKVVRIGDSLAWQTVPTDSAEAAVPVAAYERAMEAVHEYGIPHAYRPSTVANWAVNQAVFMNLMGENLENSVRMGWRSAISIAHMPEYQAFKELRERGFEQGQVYWPHAERMLANAERFEIGQGALAVLPLLRDGKSPAGNMANIDDQLDALADQFPVLEAETLGVAMMPKRVSATIRLAAQSGNVEHVERHTVESTVHANEVEDERLRTVAACRKALVALSRDTSYQIAGITFEREGAHMVAYTNAPLRKSLAALVEDGQSTDAPCAIARLPLQHSRRDLIVALRDYMADNAIRVAQCVNQLAAKLKLPEDHQLRRPDTQSDIRFNLIVNGNDISLYVGPTQSDRTDMGALNCELRIFTDSPRAHLFMTQGDPTNFRGVSFVPENATFPEATRYSILVDMIAKTFNEAVPVALAKAAEIAKLQAGDEVEFDEDAEDFQVSLIAQKYTEEDLEAGEGGEVVEMIESEAYSARQLQRIIRERGISHMQVDPAEPASAAFVSETPDENREYFEEGIHTYYRLTLEKVRGLEATPQDAADFASRFDLKQPQELVTQAPVEKRSPAMRLG